jgi:hypothetical protein
MRSRSEVKGKRDEGILKAEVVDTRSSFEERDCAVVKR